MVKKPDKNTARLKRHARVRKKISGTAARPRLNVFRSAKHIYAQLIDDVAGVTLASASSMEKGFEGFGGNKVLTVKDYKSGVFTDVATGNKSESPLPASDVLYYNLEDRAWLCVRPSGTEPKIKFYMGVKAESSDAALAKVEAMEKSVDELLEKIN